MFRISHTSQEDHQIEKFTLDFSSRFLMPAPRLLPRSKTNDYSRGPQINNRLRASQLVSGTTIAWIPPARLWPNHTIKLTSFRSIVVLHASISRVATTAQENQDQTTTTYNYLYVCVCIHIINRNLRCLAVNIKILSLSIYSSSRTPFYAEAKQQQSD